MGTLHQLRPSSEPVATESTPEKRITMDDGHTRIAHGLLEELMQAKYKLSGREYAVLLVVIRKTYGYMKSEDWIALSQFEAMTGIAKQDCRKVIKGLVERKIVIRVAQGNDQKLAVNTNISDWLQERPSKKLETAKRLARKTQQVNPPSKQNNPPLNEVNPPSKQDSPPTTIDKDKHNNLKDIVPAEAETAPRTKKRSFRFDPADLQFAHYMEERITVVTGYHNKRTNIESWANDIRLMRERDGHNPEQIAALFNFANTHPVNNGGFSWSTVILSPDKLRQKWPQLMAQYRSGLNAPQQSKSTIDRLTDRSWDNDFSMDLEG